jgi:hypothetical protein
MVYDVQMHNFTGCALRPLGLTSIYQQILTGNVPTHV